MTYAVESEKGTANLKKDDFSMIHLYGRHIRLKGFLLLIIIDIYILIGFNESFHPNP